MRIVYMTNLRRMMIAVVTMAMVTGVGCTGGRADTSGDPLTSEDWYLAGTTSFPVVDASKVTGRIVTAGSSTVFPLSERLVERFADEGYAGQISVDSIGSGAGFERFCVTGESDIANASRAIKSAEVESCRGIGREPLEIRVGTDALAVVVAKSNSFARNATVTELAMIFGAATNWSDVNAAWPSRPIQRFIPGTDSGTFDYFVERVFDGEQGPILGASNVQLSEDDNILVQGVAGSQYAVGFFGHAFFAENSSRLNILNIDGVAASDASVDSGDYPLARPLYIYTTGRIMVEKPQVAAFVNFYLNFVNDEAADVGYYPANPAALQGAREAWLQANQGRD